MDVLVVFCTCPDRESAEQLASLLVEERLAACVNLLPGVQSVYRWEGKVSRDEEVLLLMKTTVSRVDALKARVLAQHPYELPEFIAVKADSGLAPYLAWVQQETMPPLS